MEIEKTVATQIVSQMSSDDRAFFDPTAWRQGVALMLVDEWAGVDLDEVLEEIEDILN